MDPVFDMEGPPVDLKEIGFRIDYLRTNKNGCPYETIGEMAKAVGTTIDRIRDSGRFYRDER